MDKREARRGMERSDVNMVSGVHEYEVRGGNVRCCQVARRKMGCRGVWNRLGCTERIS